MYWIRVLFHVHHIQSIEKLGIVQVMFYREVVHLKLIDSKEIKTCGNFFRSTYDNEQ
jgi:hypothetical protein